MVALELSPRGLAHDRRLGLQLRLIGLQLLVHVVQLGHLLLVQRAHLRGHLPLARFGSDTLNIDEGELGSLGERGVGAGALG